MAWIVCSECLSEFPLNQIEQYVRHKQERCQSEVSTSRADPEFHCGYCMMKFNTSLALLLHVGKHDVKVEIANRELKLRKQELFGRVIRHRQETSCESDMDADSCCDEDDEESFCGSHGKVSEHGSLEVPGANEVHEPVRESATASCSALLPHNHEPKPLSSAVSTDAAVRSSEHLDTHVVVCNSGSAKPADFHSCSKSADAISNAGTAHSVAHSSVTSSHHRVKRHACAQTACTAFEQKSRCCCVDLNGQVMRLVSLGIIKLPNCCDPPPVTEHFHAHAHHHCAAKGESRAHVHGHERSESGSKRARQSAELSSPGAAEAASLTSEIKAERSSPCVCTSGCCERCVKRERADGECQTEFEWDLDVDFDVDALLDASAPPTLADLAVRQPEQGQGSQFDLNSVDSSQTGSCEPVPPFQQAQAFSRVFDEPFSGGASLESLSLAGRGTDMKRMARYTETSGAQGTLLLAPDTQQLFLSRDAGLLFAQPSSMVPPPPPLLASSHGKVFQCEQCGREFKQAIHLRKHNWSMHSNDGKPYKCPLTSTGECSYASVEKTHLQAHIRTHTGEKPYKCKYCEYAGKQSSTLRSHMLHKHPQEMLNERQQAAGLSPKHL